MCQSTDRLSCPSQELLGHHPSESTSMIRPPRPIYTRDSTNTWSMGSYTTINGTTACPTPAPYEEDYDEIKKNPFDSDQVTVNSSFHQRFVESSYNVETLAKHDDIDLLPQWKRYLHKLSPLFTFLAVGAYFLYFSFRIYCTIMAQEAYDKVYAMAWVFIGAEACVAFPAFFHQMWILLHVGGRHRPKLRLRGDTVPTVDVFITCCKEDVDVVLDTTRAACAVDYPQDRFRVIVLDDGADPELKEATEDLRSQYPNVYYHARIKIKGQPHHAKAGNLMGGTELVTTLPGGAGEFIAALDADMIPESDWLRAIMAHMVVDPKMSLVCPPQMFYNVPENDPLVQSLDGFIHVMEPTKDASGVAWCTGSGYAIRRSALESIGGWPTGSLAEDVCTSSMLLGAGWKTAYCHEPLQFGTVPDTITGHLKQRTRWTLGTLQTATKLRFCLWGSIIKQMTFFQRLSGFIFTVDAFFKIFFMISMLTIPVVLISGGNLVAYVNDDQLKWQTRFCLISLICTRINEWITYIPSGYRLGQRETGAMMWMAPFHSLTIIQSYLLPKWLGGKPMGFSSSGSIKDELNERDAAHRAPLYRRLKVVIWDCKCWIHLLYIAFVLAAVILSCYRAATTTHTTRSLLIYLLTHALWPPVLWLLCLSAFFEPIRYAIWPPSMPDREELLDRDPKTGVAHPKAMYKKQRWGARTFWREGQYSLLTAFTALIFAASFFFL
ncbi:glycosyltransferase family 2 protein [Saccharata proteae CBS 121410]|uniref:Glycosyltransferase family 2 protein n=1 Tax=Saccharata proteae CBS 121410 TaxID=1314787 RepID=A0A9P4HVF2_9PEZI|nr:glycosyltransferase family 2 protein [Saccharata proteae CBS 121410]